MMKKIMNKSTYVISLGGSLVVPSEGIDWKFLKNFRLLIKERIKKGDKFFLVVGGGATCRNYQDAARRVVDVKSNDLDWIGIHSSRLNAHLLRTIFWKIAHPEIITNPTRQLPCPEKIMIAGGWKPGWSTDYVAVMIAQKYNIKTVINLSNIDYVYDKDPKKYQDAKKIERISWKNFRKIVGNKWDPGMNLPFDPVASKKGEQRNIEVSILNGSNLNNLKKYLDGKKFKGTMISD